MRMLEPLLATPGEKRNKQDQFTTRCHEYVGWHGWLSKDYGCAGRKKAGELRGDICAIQ
jgi:hypothetical protein